MAAEPTTEAAEDEFEPLYALYKRLNINSWCDWTDGKWHFKSGSGQGPPVTAADVKLLVAWLDSNSHDYHSWPNRAAQALGDLARFGRFTPASKLVVMRALIDVVKNGGFDRDFRQDAADSLAAMGRDARIALPTLLSFWREHTPSGGPNATGAICRIIGADGELLEAIDRLVAGDLARQGPRKPRKPARKMR